MPYRSNKIKEISRAIAKERIGRLLRLSNAELNKGDMELSRRYSRLALKMQEHYKVRPSLKYKVCKRCGTMLVAGITSSTRLSSRYGYIVIKCTSCGAEMHKVYKK